MSRRTAFMASLTSTRAAGGASTGAYTSNFASSRSTAYTAPSVTPYLGLRARLSQIWLNRWTILLILVLARTLIAIKDMNSDLGSARREALSACSSVESMGSAMASMPHYMSQGVNELTASGIEKSVNALMQTSLLALTGVEEIVVFVIGMMTNTYLCLITFAVTGSAKVVIDGLEASQKALDGLTKSLGDDMADVVSDFSKAYDKVRDALKGKILGISSGIDLPDLNIGGDIDKLRKLQIPSGFSDDLEKLKQHLPNFDEVKNFTDSLIRLPFEEVKKLVNQSLGTYTFNRSAFPVPPKEQLSFCSDDDGINNFFDNLFRIAAIAKKVFIGVLLVAAILVCIPMAWREIRRWNLMKESSQLVGAPGRDPMDAVYIVSRPYTARAGLKVANSSRFERRQALVRWVVAYATSEAALFVLSLAIAGLFSCLCQYIIAKSLEKEVPALTAQVAGFSDKVIDALNNASTNWANGANKVIVETNSTINQDMFGWVNTSTTAVNNTLNLFVDKTSQVLNTTFGGTPLMTPIMEVLNCLVLLKLQGIQKGLTWVHDHAHVSLPLMKTDTFTLGAAASIASDSTKDDSFLANPGDKAADKISDTVARFLDALYKSIQTEALISTAVLMIWVVVLLIGIIRALTLWFGHDRVRGEVGGEPLGGEKTPIIDTSRDFRSDNQDRFRHEYQVPRSSDIDINANANADTNAHDVHLDHGLPAYSKGMYRPGSSIRPPPTISNKGGFRPESRGYDSKDPLQWHDGDNRI